MAYWILQGNPDIYDSQGALEAGTIDKWRIVRHLDDISPGDEFALWVSGPNAGAYALGIITESRQHSTDSDPFWVDADEGDKPAWRIGIRISHKLEPPVFRSDLRADPDFAGSMILRMPGGGNPFPVTPDEWLALRSHIAGAEANDTPEPTRPTLTATDLLAVLSDNHAIEHLREYFGTVAIAASPGFTGSRFDTLDGGGARPDTRDRITAADLIAVQCLDVVVPASASLDLLEGHLGASISAYLRRIPCGVALGRDGARDHVTPDSAADLAWHLLNQQDGVGWVIAGKILARKRTGLIPVWDKVVRCAFGYPQNAWLWLDDLLRKNDAVNDLLSQLHHDARLPDLVPRLRVLDTVVWMRHREHHQDKDCPGIFR